MEVIEMEEIKSINSNGIVIITRLIGILFLAHSVNYLTLVFEEYIRVNTLHNYVNFVFSSHFYWNLFRFAIFLVPGISFLFKSNWILEKVSWENTKEIENKDKTETENKPIN
jgi:hypothetical protein